MLATSRSHLTFSVSGPLNILHNGLMSIQASIFKSKLLTVLSIWARASQQYSLQGPLPFQQGYEKDSLLYNLSLSIPAIPLDEYVTLCEETFSLATCGCQPVITKISSDACKSCCGWIWQILEKEAAANSEHQQPWLSYTQLHYFLAVLPLQPKRIRCLYILKHHQRYHGEQTSK